MGQDVFIDVIVRMEQHVMVEQEFVFVEWESQEDYVIKVCIIHKQTYERILEY